MNKQQKIEVCPICKSADPFTTATWDIGLLDVFVQIHCRFCGLRVEGYGSTAYRAWNMASVANTVENEGIEDGK